MGKKRLAKTGYYGPHLMVEAYGIDPKKLDDIGLLFDFLDGFPEVIGMHKFSVPQLGKFKEAAIAGVSGFVFIKESHIAFHTYSKKGFIAIDIFSCKDFEAQKAIDYIKNTFEIEDENIDQELKLRGKRFPVKNIYP
ncbi:MAG: adenosylmethionine decarboxylase [Candidatus Falkowbacteria bacterium]